VPRLRNLSLGSLKFSAQFSKTVAKEQAPAEKVSGQESGQVEVNDDLGSKEELQVNGSMGSADKERGLGASFWTSSPKAQARHMPLPSSRTEDGRIHFSFKTSFQLSGFFFKKIK
jgi:hypothetical protein